MEWRSDINKEGLQGSTHERRGRRHQEAVSAQSLDDPASKCPVVAFTSVWFRDGFRGIWGETL